jgi:poly(A) polymerase Pap1
MKAQNLYETPEEFQHRVDVLQLLLELVPQWVQTVAEHLGRSEAEIEAAHGFVFSYGSFRLSTHGPGRYMPWVFFSAVIMWLSFNFGE